MRYLDFDLDLREHSGHHYQISARGPVGEASTVVPFPLTDAELETQLLRLENAILRSTGRRRIPQTAEERLLQRFGQQLFDFLLHGEVRTLYYEALQAAGHQQGGVRLRLHIQPPALALLPWEFLYDPRRGDYLALDPYTPLVRYLDLPQRIQPLPVNPPLRILGIVASPSDLAQLDVATEKANLERALQGLRDRGLVELTWLPGATWRDLQRAMRSTAGPWHIFHFIGHGGFDETRGEGVLYLADEDGRSRAIGATQLSRLLAGQRYSLRLAVLNACEGARGGREDILSSTAAALVQGGLPAVLAMQYDITDLAAVELAQSFYEGLADGLPVDTAVADARNAVSLANERSLEWGTPVLYMRAPDGQLFDINLAVGTSTVQNEDPENHGLLTNITTVYQSSPNREGSAPTEQQVNHLPVEFEWAPISGGAFLMGSDKQKDKDAYDDELPQHSVTVADFKIARVPVTVTQFAIFVEATGYQTTAEKEGSARSWTGERWELVQGAYWAAPRGSESNVRDKADHPVTCLSWHDANAFCTWATEVYRAAGQPIAIRLPTEAEWEKAARGTDGRLWPWGDAPPDQEHCNFNKEIGDTTSVKRYQTGIHGLYDMVGNVWEWTNSLHKTYPYQADDGREDPVTVGNRVMRGGAFGFARNLVRCACRGVSDPDVCFGFIGFRVVCSGS